LQWRLPPLSKRNQLLAEIALKCAD